jgi:hypothetical protein
VLVGPQIKWSRILFECCGVKGIGEKGFGAEDRKDDSLCYVEVSVEHLFCDVY